MRKVILLLFSLSSFCLPLIHAEEDDLDAAFDSAFIDLAELTGEERKETIQRLCKSEDSEAALPLISVLTEPANEDSDKTLEQVFSALMRFKSKEIEEELKQLLQSPDPRLQGFGFKIYARTYGKSGARELLSWLSRAQGPAFQDLIAALRNCPVPTPPEDEGQNRDLSDAAPPGRTGFQRGNSQLLCDCQQYDPHLAGRSQISQ